MKYLRLVVMVTMLLATELLAEQLSTEQYYQKILKFTPEQLALMRFSINKGAKVNRGETLAAIAWKESNMGEYLMNLADGNKYYYKGSFGPYHNLLNSVMRREEYKSQWNASRVAEKLVMNREFASDQALIELELWSRYWKHKGVGRQYSHMVASYNAGTIGYECRSGYNYSRDILLRVKAIHRYIEEHPVPEVTLPDIYGCDYRGFITLD